MNRRRFISVTVAAGATASISGCMGYTVEKTSEIDRRKQKIRKQSTRIDELDEEIESLSESKASLNEEVKSLNESNADLKSRLEEKEEQLADAKGKQVLYLYGYGLTAFNNGTDFYNSAIDRYDNDNYQGARADWNVASAYFDSATNDFKGAADRASKMGASTVEQYANDAKMKSNAYTETCIDYQTGVYNFLNGNSSEAEEYMNQGDSHYDTAQKYSVRDRSKLEDLLGTSIE